VSPLVSQKKVMIEKGGGGNREGRGVSGERSNGVFVVEEGETAEGIVDQQLFCVWVDLQRGALQGEMTAHELGELEGGVESADAVECSEGVVSQEKVAAVWNCLDGLEGLLGL
jgi:hypothetical protein